MARSYGLAANSNLAAAGMQVQNEAIGMMGNLAAQEQQRNTANAQIRAKNKESNAQIGSAIGGIVGSFIPIPVVGTMIGSALGGMIGGMF